LLEYKTALLEYIDLFVLDVLINQSIINHSCMIYCTSRESGSAKYGRAKASPVPPLEPHPCSYIREMITANLC